MKNDISNKVSKVFNKTCFKLKKHSPEILIVAGVVGVVASTVMACKATMKVNDILENAGNDINNINDCVTKMPEDYTMDDRKKDLAVVYIQTGVKLAKLYTPSVAVGTLSLVSIVASHNILHKRNIAVAAAYAALDKGFKEYRGRVAERFGEEVERELKYNIKAKKFEDEIVDENGKTEKSKVTVKTAEVNDYSSYSRFFDSASPYWDKTPEYNLQFLRSMQNYANNMLQAKGYLYLNDVYKMLGIPETKEGQVVGWIFDEDNPVGDNYVDFGIYETYRDTNRDFVNGYENVILLDFNVDGNIWELMK